MTAPALAVGMTPKRPAARKAVMEATMACKSGRGVSWLGMQYLQVVWPDSR